MMSMLSGKSMELYTATNETFGSWQGCEWLTTIISPIRGAL
jgi:hypothetical protein